MLLLNAFSLNMLSEAAFSLPVSLIVSELCTDDVAKLATRGYLDSAVGHADTAAVFSSMLGVQVKCARRTVSLQPGDRAIVGQYVGPRLPEGATCLPPGATIRWFQIEVDANYQVY